MVLAGQNDECADGQNRRSEPRNEVRLPAACDVGGAVPRVVVRDLSATGMLIETGADLPLGDMLTVALYDDVRASGRVVWRSGSFYGFEFEQPLSRSVVSAARLLSPWQREAMPDHEAAESERLGSGLALSDAANPSPWHRNRRYVLLALGALAWAPVLAMTRWLS